MRSWLGRKVFHPRMNTGSTMNETLLFYMTLEAASDYKCRVEGLDEPGKAIVKKLREWAGNLAKVAGKKWKRTFLLQFFE
jgi:hypothetical protein